MVYSGGIGRSINFELDLIEKYNSTVFSFDPTLQSKNFIAEQTLPKKFKFFNHALSGREGKIGFSHIRRGSNRYLPGTILNMNFKKKSEVIATTIPNMMRTHNHDHIGLLKLDIEGGEYDVIRNLLEYEIYPNQIVLEFHPQILNYHHHGSYLGFYGWKETVHILNRLKEVGYTIFFVSDRGTEMSLSRKC